ncbi:MAG: hypothetical protein QOD34_170 [Mycobacterium sp.]|nr:hypothetical protein [Mycobacterium sp.]
MDWATLGDVHQLLPLTVVEVTGQLDLAIDMGDPAGFGFAVGAILCVNPVCRNVTWTRSSCQPLRSAYIRTVIEVHEPSHTLSAATIFVGVRPQSPTMTMTTPITIATDSEINRKPKMLSWTFAASWSPAAIGANLRPAPHAAASNVANQFA